MASAVFVNRSVGWSPYDLQMTCNSAKGTYAASSNGYNASGWSIDGPALTQFPRTNKAQQLYGILYNNKRHAKVVPGRFANGTPRESAWNDWSRIWREATRIRILILSKLCIYTLDLDVGLPN